MHRSLPLLVLAIVVLVTARAASAQTAAPTASAAAAPDCERRGGVTVVGRAPMPLRGRNVVLRIAADSVEVESYASDAATEIRILRPLESHMSNLNEYATALAQNPAPVPSVSVESFAAIQAAYDARDARRRMSMLALGELAPVAVTTSGDFSCGGLTAGSYVALLTESEIIPSTAEQRSWGRNLPNVTLYETRFVVPQRRTAATLRLRSPFTVVARFRPRGA